MFYKRQIKFNCSASVFSIKCMKLDESLFQVRWQELGNGFFLDSIFVFLDLVIEFEWTPVYLHNERFEGVLFVTRLLARRHHHSLIWGHAFNWLQLQLNISKSVAILAGTDLLLRLILEFSRLDETYLFSRKFCSLIIRIMLPNDTMKQSMIPARVATLIPRTLYS